MSVSGTSSSCRRPPARLTAPLPPGGAVPGLLVARRGIPDRHGPGVDLPVIPAPTVGCPRPTAPADPRSGRGPWAGGRRTVSHRGADHRPAARRAGPGRVVVRPWVWWTARHVEAAPLPDRRSRPA